MKYYTPFPSTTLGSSPGTSVTEIHAAKQSFSSKFIVSIYKKINGMTKGKASAEKTSSKKASPLSHNATQFRINNQ